MEERGRAWIGAMTRQMGERRALPEEGEGKDKEYLVGKRCKSEWEVRYDDDESKDRANPTTPPSRQ